MLKGIIDHYLSTFSRAYFNQKELYIASKICPDVVVPRLDMKYPVFGYERFNLPANGGLRDARSRAAELPFQYSLQSMTLAERALEIPLIDKEQSSNIDIMDLGREKTELVTDTQLLLKEYNVAGSFFNATAMSGNVLDLGAGGLKQWDDYTTPSTPFKDVVITAAGAITTATGRTLPELTLVMGYSVFNALRAHPTIRDQFKYTSNESITEEMLARYFGIKQVLVGYTSYNSTNDPVAASLLPIWGKKALLAYVNDNPGIKSASFAHNFVWDKENLIIEKYVDYQTRNEIVRSVYTYNPYVVGKNFGYLIDNAIS